MGMHALLHTVLRTDTAGRASSRSVCTLAPSFPRRYATPLLPADDPVGRVVKTECAGPAFDSMFWIGFTIAVLPVLLPTIGLRNTKQAVFRLFERRINLSNDFCLEHTLGCAPHAMDHH